MSRRKKFENAGEDDMWTIWMSPPDFDIAAGVWTRARHARGRPGRTRTRTHTHTHARTHAPLEN